jgi:outer membrane lipoprotein-sorting protein
MHCATSEVTAMRLARIAALLALVTASTAAQAQTALEIIAASDQVRNPDQPFRSTDTLTEFTGGKPRDQDVLVVYSKLNSATRQYRNLIRYVQPPRDQGKMVLLDGKSLWFYDPNSKASVRISPQQRLIGQASIADVLTVNFAIDYTGKLLGDESIQDPQHQIRQCWHLDMKAANDQASYNRVEYWVEHGSNYPIKAKFYSDSGRLLKILYYDGFEQRLGRIRPSKAIIVDAVDTALATTVAFGDVAPQEIPEAWFQRDYLPRLQAQ